MKAYCQARGHIYLDYFSKMVDDKGMLKAELANDGLHPNAAAYRRMGTRFADVLQASTTRSPLSTRTG